MLVHALLVPPHLFLPSLPLPLPPFYSYRAHEALLSAVSCLRPETAAKLATSLASCLAVACENMANSERYSIRPMGDVTPFGWEYVWGHTANTYELQRK